MPDRHKFDNFHHALVLQYRSGLDKSFLFPHEQNLINQDLQKHYFAGSPNLPPIFFSIPPPTQVNIHRSPRPPTHPFLSVISVQPTTHLSIIHSFICSSYDTGSCLGRDFFSLTVQKTKCSWGWQQASQIEASKWHLLFVTASRERAASRRACDPLAGSLHGGNQTQSDFSHKTPHCSASFLPPPTQSH